jgi:hypothetical protein
VHGTRSRQLHAITTPLATAVPSSTLTAATALFAASYALCVGF